MKEVYLIPEDRVISM